MRETHTNVYVPGTFWYECDICGWDYLFNELRKNSDGLWVCSKDYEPLHERLQKRNKIRERPFKGAR